MNTETILYAVQDGVATITLNRPDSRNALNNSLYQELLKAFRTIDRDKSIRAVVLTGSGKGFSSGQDLGELQDGLANGMKVGELLRAQLNTLIFTMRSLEKPIVGAINGVAAGAGASVALATDIRIMSSEASFVFAAFANIGIIPDGGMTYFLPELVGANKAFELAVLADGQNRVLPEQAHTLGIVSRVVAPDALHTESQALALKLANMATVAIGRTKRAIYHSLGRGLADSLEYEAQVQEGMFRTHDFHEGVSAFREKRAPKFTGE